MDEGGAGAAEAGGALDSYYADDHYGDEKMRQVIVWTASQSPSVLWAWYTSALSAFITAAGAVKQTESGLPGGALLPSDPSVHLPPGPFCTATICVLIFSFAGLMAPSAQPRVCLCYTHVIRQACHEPAVRPVVCAYCSMPRHYRHVIRQACHELYV